MKEILFKYVIDCKVKDKTERVFILVNIKNLENSNDFNELLFNRADEAFKELIGHECHCINESQSFCDCGESIDDFEIVERLGYIGIEDKNGDKIFQGDRCKAITTEKITKEILKSEDDYLQKNKCLKPRNLKKVENIWTVEYVNHLTYSGYRFYGDDRRFNIKVSSSTIHNNNIKIIGNIYDKDQL